MFGSAASGRPAPRISRERRERGGRAGAVVCPDRGDVELARGAAAASAADPAGDLGVVVEGEQRDDRERRDAAHGLDRDDELVEVEERLDHEQVDAAALEHRRLLRIERPVLGRIEDLELAERPDRAGDEHVLSGDLARLAREPDAGRVDLLERVVEHARASLRRFAPKVFVSISSAPAAM